MSRPGRVVVVGAGLTGLAAAWRLSRRGFDVAVCERRSRPGGRVATERVEDTAVDTAWPVLSSSDRRLLAWIDEVGVRDDLLPLRPVLAAQAHAGRVSEIESGSWLSVARTPGVRPREALRLLRLPRLLGRYARRVDPSRPALAAALDDRSLADFGRLYFGRSVLERWMAPLVAAPSLADPEQASRVLFLQRYRRQRDALLGLPRGPLAELPEAAAARLKVLYEAEVVRVERPPGADLRIEVSRGGLERTIEADAVVVSVAAPEALRLAERGLAGAERDFLAGVTYVPGITLAVGLRRALHPHPVQISIPPREDRPVQTALLEPGVAGGRVPRGAGLATLRAAPDWAEASAGAPDDAIEKALLEAFVEIHPGARGAISFARLLRESRAHPRFEVGHYRALARFERVQEVRRREGRRVYFAGDYLMEPTWEGAVASGLRAAEALAADARA